MRNNGLFSALFIEGVRDEVGLDDFARGRLATLTQTWQSRDGSSAESLWSTFLKQALGYLQFVPAIESAASGAYPLFEDHSLSRCIAVLYLMEPGSDIDDQAVGRFWPGKLLVQMNKRKVNWGILTDGGRWRLYSTKSSRPYEDYVKLELSAALEASDESEYALFERFFHRDSFVPEEEDEDKKGDEAVGVYKCRLDRDVEQSEEILEEYVKAPLLYQVDEVLQYLCNGFIADTPRKGEEYTENERKEIFESAVKLLYRCLFLFYAEARKLLPSERDKTKTYEKHSMRALCGEAHRFQWGERKDRDGYDLWKHLKGLVNAVNEGDPEYGIMGYDGGLFDDREEKFLSEHKLRNDFLCRALYLLAYVEPYDGDEDEEHEIPYEDLEVRHLGELYENILEYTVILADADLIRRRTKKGVETLLASETKKARGDRVIRKGDIYFGESALERKQTGSYYTPESLVRFLNGKAIIEPLRQKFEDEYRPRFNEFLEHISSGLDAAARRGAARSAIALIQRFVDEVLLEFKVCDPAMGSGHFLVNASNQMAGLVVKLLAEIPDVEGTKSDVVAEPNCWRRSITRRCLYGVDLNPLAVDLAKLSLWLNCFAVDHKLTFLDHHLRCGNSLIGARTLDQLRTIPKRRKDRKKRTHQPLLTDWDDLTQVLAHAGEAIESLAEIDEDDMDRQKGSYDEAHSDIEKRLAPLADLLTAYLMDSEITEDGYRELFTHFSQGLPPSQMKHPDYREMWKQVKAYKKRHDFFHWALEFPDVFCGDGQGGFNATVGNPPWDLLQPNTQEFYLRYDPLFRRYSKQEALAKIRGLHSRHPEIERKWITYETTFREASDYFKQTSNYEGLVKGKIDSYRAFLERFYQALAAGGNLGIVVPSGIYTDKSSQPLREFFFDNSQIQCLYGFENRRGVFNIHRMFKFVLFSTRKGEETDEFRCAFMEHEPERLPAIDREALTMRVESVRRFSPETLSIMEFRSQRDIDIAAKVYADWPLMNCAKTPSCGFAFRQELNMTSDSHLFLTELTEYPLYEGKMIWQFDASFDEPRYFLDYDDAIQVLGDAAWETKYYRVAFRGVAASTNERTLISAIMPPGFHGNNLPTVTPERGHSVLATTGLRQSLILVAILNSFCCDFVIRHKVTNNMNFFFMDSLPLALAPKNLSKERAVNRHIREQITARCARLICVDQRFANLWAAVFDHQWSKPEFWYPDGTSNLTGYGPRQEAEIRCRLREETSRLKECWGKSSGVHGRTTHRRDNDDRAQLRAEVDAYVAHLYALNRDDLEYILDTFPVLRRKEEQVFGEYVSKRKCLEEYDRISSVLSQRR